MMSVSVDSSMVKARLSGLDRSFSKGVPTALLEVGQEIMRLSQKEVPLDEGTLQNSGTVEVDGDNVVVGYNTEYAARLHEHPEYRFQKGRKGKYLEDPIKRNEDKLGLKFGETLDGLVGTK